MEQTAEKALQINERVMWGDEECGVIVAFSTSGVIAFVRNWRGRYLQVPVIYLKRLEPPAPLGTAG
jgi:hypothetical protein